MAMNTQSSDFALITVIANTGGGSRVLNVAKRFGITGGTVYLGRGTVKNRLLEFFEINDVHKEIVVMVSESCLANRVISDLNQEFHFDKKNHGIAFVMPIACVYGISRFQCGMNTKEGVEEIMYQAIYVIVEKGKAEDVVEAAVKAGSRGGTIINARGSGIHETSKLFSMEIEPQKEIVMVISKADNTVKIVQSIRDELHIDEPGKGIIYVQDVTQAYGLY